LVAQISGSQNSIPVIFYAPITGDSSAFQGFIRDHAGDMMLNTGLLGRSRDGVCARHRTFVLPHYEISLSEDGTGHSLARRYAGI